MFRTSTMYALKLSIQHIFKAQEGKAQSDIYQSHQHHTGLYTLILYVMHT